jgi:hypothetical protein
VREGIRGYLESDEERDCEEEGGVERRGVVRVR